MQLPGNLTNTQHQAIIACLRIFAELGADEIGDEQETESPSNLAGAGDSVGANDTHILAEVSTDAN